MGQSTQSNRKPERHNIIILVGESFEGCNPNFGKDNGFCKNKHGVTISAVRAITGGSNSVVECQLPKLDVAGSIPVSRSTSLSPWNSDCKYRFCKRLPICFPSMPASLQGPAWLPAQDALHQSVGHWRVPRVQERLSEQVVAFA